MWCVLCKAPQGETNLSLVSLPPSPFLLFSVAFEFEGEFRLLKRSRLTWNKKHIFVFTTAPPCCPPLGGGQRRPDSKTLFETIHTICPAWVGYANSFVNRYQDLSRVLLTRMNAS